MKYFEQRERLAKIARKRNLELDRKTLAGAYTMYGRQVVCTGYAGAVYTEIYDNITKADDGEHFDFETMIVSPNREEALEHPIDFKYSQTLDAYTEHRKENKDKIALIELDGIYVNFQVFMPVYESLGHPKVYVNKHAGNLALVYIKGDMGEGIVCPYRVLNEDNESEFSRVIIRFKEEN